MIAIRRFELTPYGQRVALDLLTGFVIVTVAVALAGLTWRMAGHAGVGAITVPRTARPAAVPDVAPAVALAPFGRAIAADAAQPTTLTLQLKGVVFARPERLSTAFIIANNEVARPFHVGDAVAGATIEAIQVNRVLIRNAGRLEFLAFPDPLAAPGAATTGGSAAPSSSQAVPPPPAPAPPPSSASASALMSRFDARPVAGGLQVGSNAPPGMRAGDVLQSVNGAALASPDAAQAAFANAQASGTAQIQILRDGKRITMTVPTR